MPGVWETVLLGTAFIATFAGTWAYRSLAIRRGIVAEPNFRSLHEGKVPRGGGIVFAIVCIAVVAGLSRASNVEPNLVRAIVVGGTVAALFGFFDDAYQISAWLKLLVQGALAMWTLWCFGGRPLYDLPLTIPAIDVAVSWLGLVWLMNICNFIDGIDGLAASAAVLVSGLAIVVLVLTRSDDAVVITLGCIVACSAAFLAFNWPPASLFMGDAGSLFLGFCFGALLAATVTAGTIQLWTWLVMFGFFAGDTTTTTVVRMFVTDKWYGEHRSHAYQNLARLSGSHLKVVQGVWLYHLMWLLPLVILAARWPASAPVAALLALGPVVLWTLRYGPRLSSS